MADSVKYPYQLVKFITTSKQKKLLAVDIVPSSWISFDNNSGQCVAKFMPPPYDAKSVAELHTLLKNCSQPPNTWTTYPVELRGHAKSYEEAVTRCDELQTKPYVYTSNSDMRSEEKAKMMEQSYRCKKNKIDKVVTKALLNVPNIVDQQSNNESDCSSVIPPTPSTESDQGTDESYTMKSRSQRKKKQINSMPSAAYKSTDCNRNYLGVSSQAITATPKSSKSKFPNQFSKKSGITIDLEPAMSDACRASLDSCSKNNHPPTPGKYIPKKTLHGARAKNYTQYYQSESASNTSNQGSNTHKNSHRVEGESLKKSDCTRKDLILAKVVGLCEDVKDLRREIRSLRTIIETVNIRNNEAHFSELDDDLTIPLTNVADFKHFDDRLGDRDNLAFRNKIMHSLRFHTDKDGILSKSIRFMLKQYFSREVMLKFTAMKKTPGKEVFKNTNFCKVMIEVLNAQNAKSNRSPVKKTDFYQQLGNVISNAKDWDGHRQYRRKRNDTVPEMNDDNINEQI